MEKFSGGDVKIGVEISANFWMASHHENDDSVVIPTENAPKTRIVGIKPPSSRLRNRNSAGSYIYVHSDSSDVDGTSPASNAVSSVSGGTMRGKTTPSTYQSSILNTLVKLTKLWDEESRNGESANLASQVTSTSAQSDNRFHVRPSPSIAGSGDGGSVQTMDTAMNSVYPGVTTTLMIRNIPLRFTPVTFREMIDEEGFSGRYDYLYMPMDFRSHRSLGYCFINFYDPESACEFTVKFSNRMFPSTNSDKVLAVSAATRQGLLANVSSFKQSTLKQVPRMEFRPVVGILGQLFPLDERVFAWLTAGQDKTSSEVQSPPPGLSALYGFS